MSSSRDLAARLRQAIQGCSLHNHGPVQAWASIERADREGDAKAEEVARLAIEACIDRIRDLHEAGVSDGDVRIKKEELTLSFIKKLLL